MTQISAADARLTWLYRVGGAAALIVVVLLLVGLIGLAGAVLQPGTTNGWSLPFRDNWLIVIFKLHAGFGGDPTGQLHEVDALDIAILALVGTVCLGLYAALRRDNRVWLVLLLFAASSPFVGIPLFVATSSAGRSGVIGAVLIISTVMLRSAAFRKTVAFIGILSGVLLGVGDISAALVPPTAVVATLFGIGYLLLVAWFFLVASRLLRLEPGAPEEHARAAGTA
jgi:hypothetical protein